MPKCPFCQSQIEMPSTKNYSVCKNCYKEMRSPFFRCYFENNKFTNYQINIIINDIIYGLDSNKYKNFNVNEGPFTKISYFNGSYSKILFKNNEYTPLPENKESIIKIVQRIINLKAFI